MQPTSLGAWNRDSYAGSKRGFYVTLPGNPSRTSLFVQYTRPLNVDGTLRVEELAKISEGYSASDIKDICQSVQLRVVNELFESGMAMEDGTNTRAISMSDFREILKIRKPSVSIDMIRAYMRWSDQFKAL